MIGRHSRPNSGRHCKAFAARRAFDWFESNLPGVCYVFILGLGIVTGILICTIITMLK